MEVDERTKLILLPKGYSSFDILTLPFGDLKKNVLATDDQLYEIREIHGSSEHDVRPEPELPLGGAVKSIIIERRDSLQGAVVKSPNLLTTNPFNIAYYALNLMYKQKEVFTSRFHTLEDILDNLTILSSHNTLISKIEQSMDILCTSIEENKDHFYKLSLDKSFDYLSTKITSLKNFLIDTPDLILTGHIKSSLYLAGVEPTTEIVNLQILKYSMDMIFGSYLSEQMKEDYLKHAKYDFSLLDEFVKRQESKNRALAAIEENMGSVVLSTKQAKNNSKISKTVKSSKKPAKKVAIGKGALDSFFKRS